MKSDFVYDGDRLVEVVLPSGSIRYEYDEYGRVLKQTLDENISESFVYDSMNRVLEYTDIFGNISGYEYNQNGRVKAVNLGDDVNTYIIMISLEDLQKKADWRAMRKIRSIMTMMT